MRVNAEANPIEFNSSFLPNLCSHHRIRNLVHLNLRRVIPDGAPIPKRWGIMETIAEGYPVGGPLKSKGVPVGEFVHTDGNAEAFVDDVPCKMQALPGKEQEFRDMLDHEFLKP